MTSSRLSAAHKLATTPANNNVIIGFDGFVDEIIQLVDKRLSPNNFEPIRKIEDFGNRILQYAGLSGNIEMVTRKIKLGGNGPILANALNAQGYLTHYIGTLGKEKIHPVFQEFASQCTSVFSLAEPAYTEALEFEDGKILLGKMAELQQIDWATLSEIIPDSVLTHLFSSADLIACTNWTMMSGMDDILQGINKLLCSSKTRPLLFIDLADPRKRNEHDIEKFLTFLGKVQVNAQVILGLNENESLQIARILLPKIPSAMCDRAAQIREHFNFSMVVIHPVRGACLATPDTLETVSGPYTSSPRITTGAGDNFNAGFIAGLLSALHPEECLYAGVYTSGFYVRNARSPNRKELVKFMDAT